MNPTDPSEELRKLDVPAALERTLWTVYHEGAKQAKRFGGSNVVLLKEKEFIMALIASYTATLVKDAYDHGYSDGFTAKNKKLWGKTLKEGKADE